jgi:O-acetyl-ADP-ribose deacetylase (regulator of RNase III)
LSLLGRLLDRSSPRRRDAAGSEDHRWVGGGGLEVSLFVGEILDAPAEAICTSTNPRLSLGGGTGKAVLEETGWGLKRKLEAILEEEARRTGRSELPVGFTCATPGGRPPHRLFVHCVASDRAHRSSREAVRLCVEGAIREAGRAACTSLALPVFGAGHANLPFEEALRAMAEALRDAPATPVERLLLVVLQPHRADTARHLLDQVLHPAP